MKLSKIGIMVVLLGIISTKTMATVGWLTVPLTVQSMSTDGCGGGSGASVTYFYLTGDTKAYYFLNSSQSATQWASQIGLALASGMPINVKYDSNGNSPGASCGFNPGNQIFVIQVNP